MSRPKGEGIHHVGYRVASTEEVLEHCKSEGARVVDEHPRTGSRGTTVAFLHPKTSFGALIELVLDQAGKVTSARVLQAAQGVVR